MSGVRLVLSDHGVQRATMQADTGFTYDDNTRTELRVVRTTFFTETGVKDATLTSRDNGFRIQRQYAVVREGGQAAAPAQSFSAGDLIRVTLSFDLPKERRFVAVTDPIPAGFEPVESWFATTAGDVARLAEQQDTDDESGWNAVWRRGTFDHVERHDDRVQLFATRLADGHHEFSYVVRATTSGMFRTAPDHVEEMYEPEVFGRTDTTTIEVTR